MIEVGDEVVVARVPPGLAAHIGRHGKVVSINGAMAVVAYPGKSGRAMFNTIYLMKRTKK